MIQGPVEFVLSKNYNKLGLQALLCCCDECRLGKPCLHDAISGKSNMSEVTMVSHAGFKHVITVTEDRENNQVVEVVRDMVNLKIVGDEIKYLNPDCIPKQAAQRSLILFKRFQHEVPDQVPDEQLPDQVRDDQLPVQVPDDWGLGVIKSVEGASLEVDVLLVKGNRKINEVRVTVQIVNVKAISSLLPRNVAKSVKADKFTMESLDELCIGGA